MNVYLLKIVHLIFRQVRRTYLFFSYANIFNVLHYNAYMYSQEHLYRNTRRGRVWRNPGLVAYIRCPPYRTRNEPASSRFPIPHLSTNLKCSKDEMFHTRLTLLLLDNEFYCVKEFLSKKL